MARISGSTVTSILLQTAIKCCCNNKYKIAHRKLNNHFCGVNRESRRGKVIQMKGMVHTQGCAINHKQTQPSIWPWHSSWTFSDVFRDVRLPLWWEWSWLSQVPLCICECERFVPNPYRLQIPQTGPQLHRHPCKSTLAWQYCPQTLLAIPHWYSSSLSSPSCPMRKHHLSCSICKGVHWVLLSGIGANVSGGRQRVSASAGTHGVHRFVAGVLTASPIGLSFLQITNESRKSKQWGMRKRTYNLALSILLLGLSCSKPLVLQGTVQQSGDADAKHWVHFISNFEASGRLMILYADQ
jgi:hypothetical protein